MKAFFPAVFVFFLIKKRLNESPDWYFCLKSINLHFCKRHQTYFWSFPLQQLTNSILTQACKSTALMQKQNHNFQTDLKTELATTYFACCLFTSNNVWQRAQLSFPAWSQGMQIGRLNKLRDKRQFLHLTKICLNAFHYDSTRKEEMLQVGIWFH